MFHLDSGVALILITGCHYRLHLQHLQLQSLYLNLQLQSLYLNLQLQSLYLLQGLAGLCWKSMSISITTTTSTHLASTMYTNVVFF
jgi:hypothetical protein